MHIGIRTNLYLKTNKLGIKKARSIERAFLYQR